MKIEITDGSSHLVIEVLTRLYPDGDSWNRNWVGITIRAMLPGFQAAFNNEMYLSELGSFHQDLQKIYTELSGSAHLSACEGFLDLAVEIDRTGHLHWTVELIHPLGSGDEAHLKFTMLSDQSYLPSLLAQMEQIAEEFPSKEKPPVGQNRGLGKHEDRLRGLGNVCKTNARFCKRHPDRLRGLRVFPSRGFDRWHLTDG